MGAITLKDWFEWNGRRCTEYGIHVSEQPPLTIPEERSKQTKVPGRPGSLTTLEGDDVFDDLMLTATCFLGDPYQIPAIASWLKGGGTVSFANRPGGFYYARIANQIPFEKILRGNPHCSFAVNFRCSPPFRYIADIPAVEITDSMSFIENPGTVYSEPIITVYGSGEISLMVGMTIIELMGIEDSITLDSTIQEAYSGDALANAKMNGDFPILLPGRNAISWEGDVSKVVIQPNWRFLV